LDTPCSLLSNNGYAKDIDLREQVLDTDPQSVISKDNVVLVVDVILYYQIIDPIKASYEIANVTDLIGRLTQTTLRSVIGEMELDDTLASGDTIIARLQTVLDEASDPWKVKVFVLSYLKLIHQRTLRMLWSLNYLQSVKDVLMY